MRIWLITVGEPLPIDSAGGERLFRTGILADLLCRRGHDVVFWSSTFDHANKRHRVDSAQQIAMRTNYQLRLLHGPAYRTNVSLKRILNHRAVAAQFRSQSRSLARPDVVLCSLPTLELCVAATDFGRRNKVPVVLDVRDLWPDLLAEVAPPPLRPLARLLLSPMFQQARIACSQASAITGTTPQYIDWALRYAGRPKRADDIDFPMGYDVRRPTAEQSQAAHDFWNQRGVGGRPNEFVACWFGMMGLYSEIETVVAAAKRLAESGRQVKFVLCGTGPNLERYRQLADACPQVVFPGWVDAAQITALLERSSVGLAPYISNQNYQQNLPNKPIEYLSAGLPIVSSLQGVLARLLAENACGLTYANHQPDRLADAVAQLYDQPQRLEAMATNARNLFQRQFVAEQVYGRMERYLVSIANRSESRSKSLSRVPVAA